jgi:hypothetical protein
LNKNGRRVKILEGKDWTVAHLTAKTPIRNEKEKLAIESQKRSRKRIKGSENSEWSVLSEFFFFISIWNS